MHVDGFRFDLASTLARELHAVDRLAAFFEIIHQDPIISRVKLLTEPWELGDRGDQRKSLKADHRVAAPIGKPVVTEKIRFSSCLLHSLST